MVAVRKEGSRATGLEEASRQLGARHSQLTGKAKPQRGLNLNPTV